MTTKEELRAELGAASVELQKQAERIEQLTSELGSWRRTSEKFARELDEARVNVWALADANSLLARTQDGRAKRPKEACSDQVLLDYDIGQHLRRQSWQWDDIKRQWRKSKVG